MDDRRHRGRGRHRGEGRWGGPPRMRRGEIRTVLLAALTDGPGHGYDVMQRLEDKTGGAWRPSPGSVYPTLQLLEDQGYVRAVEEAGKRVYHITPEGEAFLEEHRDTIEDIFDRVRDTVRDFAGGAMGDLHQAFARVASQTYKRAWRYGPGHPAVPRIVDILKKAADEIEKEWDRT